MAFRCPCPHRYWIMSEASLSTATLWQEVPGCRTGTCVRPGGAERDDTLGQPTANTHIHTHRNACTQYGSSHDEIQSTESPARAQARPAGRRARATCETQNSKTRLGRRRRAPERLRLAAAHAEGVHTHTLGGPRLGRAAWTPEGHSISLARGEGREGLVGTRQKAQLLQGRIPEQGEVRSTSAVSRQSTAHPSPTAGYRPLDPVCTTVAKNQP